MYKESGETPVSRDFYIKVDEVIFYDWKFGFTIEISWNKLSFGIKFLIQRVICHINNPYIFWDDHDFSTVDFF
jgi:hypothetical protein